MTLFQIQLKILGLKIFASQTEKKHIVRQLQLFGMKTKEETHWPSWALYLWTNFEYIVKNVVTSSTPLKGIWKKLETNLKVKLAKNWLSPFLWKIFGVPRRNFEEKMLRLLLLLWKIYGNPLKKFEAKLVKNVSASSPPSPFPSRPHRWESSCSPEASLLSNICIFIILLSQGACLTLPPKSVGRYWWHYDVLV